GRRDCPTGPWRTARAGPAPPVRPVLSGRDQASPTPTMTIPHPLKVPMPVKISCYHGNLMVAARAIPSADSPFSASHAFRVMIGLGEESTSLRGADVAPDR